MGELTASIASDHSSRLEVALCTSTGRDTVEFACDEIEGRTDDDFLLPLALLPSMAQQLDLTLPGLHSSALRRSLPTLQRTFAAWFRAFRAGTITAPESAGRTDSAAGRGTVALFSGGVDSFHTVLTNRKRIDALLVVSGFDFAIGRREEPDADGMIATLRAAADRLGLPLLHLRTTIRGYTDRWLLWGDHYVGSALATVALLMSGRFAECIVASTHTSRDGFPYGTHPFTDPLWSTEEMRISVHGLDSSRAEKVAEISQSEVALDTLRVCWENRAGSYNCGSCEKCQRTVTELYLAGSLERCRTLPHEIDLDKLAAIPVYDASRLVFAKSLLLAAQRSTMPLASAIHTALASAIGDR